MGKPFVAIEGVIGIGKTTLANKLAKVYGGIVVPEPVETNPYLELFYRDPVRYGILMQLHLLHARYLLHQQAVVIDDFVCADRSIYGDTVFARNLHASGQISNMEWRTYQLAWESMRSHLVFPDLMIFLYAPVEVYVERIRLRGRKCEEGITPEYLSNLDKWYTVLYEEMQCYTQCVRFDWTESERYTQDVYTAIDKASDSGFTWARKRATR